MNKVSPKKKIKENKETLKIRSHFEPNSMTGYQLDIDLTFRNYLQPVSWASKQSSSAHAHKPKHWFHVILSIVINYTNSNKYSIPTNGNFNVFWHVAKLKNQHINVICSKLRWRRRKWISLHILHPTPYHLGWTMQLPHSPKSSKCITWMASISIISISTLILKHLSSALGSRLQYWK